MRGNNHLRRFLVVGCLVLLLIVYHSVWALPVDSGIRHSDQRPIIIVTVDKLDSIELFTCKLPTIKRLLSVSACGLMNVRSGSGFSDTASGYLTLGAGSRSIAPGTLGGTFKPSQPLGNGQAQSYLEWSFKPTPNKSNPENLIVPEIGWMINQSYTEDHSVHPGKMGELFRSKGWSTCLIGNIDNPDIKNRPGGLLLMDRQGIIDEGNIDDSVNEFDLAFPYFYRFSISKSINELDHRLSSWRPTKLIDVEFGDFARLDSYQSEIMTLQYRKLKQATWIKFDRFLGELIKLELHKPFSLIIVSPSVSKDSVIRKNLLAPIIIHHPDYPPGLLYSGTTRWQGLVANIDLLPTLVKMADFSNPKAIAGKLISVKPEKNYLMKLTNLNQRLIAINTYQRPLLDWYMGIIVFCWTLGLISFYGKKSWLGNWFITSVTTVPLTLMMLPLLPFQCWQVTGFLLLTLLLSGLLTQIKAVNERMLILSGLLWAVLVLDQIMGWPLIRFSALGYSAMAGSRYYGMGNELMGIFIAVSLLLAHLLNSRQPARGETHKWSAPVILGISIFVLSWPQLGAKFGGIIVGAIGFSYYLIKLYDLKLKNRKLWVILVGGGLTLFLISWWDSLRPLDLQSHIGRFVHLVLSKDFIQVQQIIARKFVMNLKLTVVSPWIRIILLALGLGVLNRLITKEDLVEPAEDSFWRATLVSGLAAYLFNDAGVLAFATCLTYGFSFILLKKFEIVSD